MILSNSSLMRKADEEAIIGGIPSVTLMENAAGHIACAAMRMCPPDKPIYIFSGSGNNGGDGICAAVLLKRNGYRVKTYIVGSRAGITPDSAEMERRLNVLGERLLDFSASEPVLKDKLAGAGVIIDAIFGIGLCRDVSGVYRRAIELINASGVRIISADIPSGVQADTGLILGAAVRAARTITFSLAKPGHFIEPGCTFCGRVEVVDIGIPRNILQKAKTAIKTIDGTDISLPHRNPLSHKGDYGRLLIIGGSVGYTGAPSMCAEAAVRSGAGLVSLGVPRDIYNITAVKNNEAMPFPLASDADGRLTKAAGPVIMGRLAESDVCIVGPGMGRSDDTAALVNEIVATTEKPLVLDADGLFAVSGSMEVLKQTKAPVVLTPHEGEFARMGGDLSKGRLIASAEFSKEHGCVLVLKGHRTIIAFPDGEIYISTCGNPGMAKGGTGDVLAGMIGALLCQMPLKQAVITAVFLHGRAGDSCREIKGEYSMTATDIINELPGTIKKFIT